MDFKLSALICDRGTDSSAFPAFLIVRDFLACPLSAVPSAWTGPHPLLRYHILPLRPGSCYQHQEQGAGRAQLRYNSRTVVTQSVSCYLDIGQCRRDHERSLATSTSCPRLLLRLHSLHTPVKPRPPRGPLVRKIDLGQRLLL